MRKSHTNIALDVAGLSCLMQVTKIYTMRAAETSEALKLTLSLLTNMQAAGYKMHVVGCVRVFRTH